MSNKKEQILKLSGEGKPAKEIAKIVGTSIQNVYSVRYLSKKPIVKAKGLARKKKILLTKKKDKDVYRWVHAETLDPKLKIDMLLHEIIGYKAVISYLEHQLGLAKTQ